MTACPDPGSLRSRMPGRGGLPTAGSIFRLVRGVRKTLPREFMARAVAQTSVGTSNQPIRYGTITTADGRDLAELMVRNGLAMVRGFNVAEEGADKIQKLKELEAEAKAEKRGAWKLSHW